MSEARRITVELSDHEWDLFQLWRKKIAGQTRVIAYTYGDFTLLEENEAVALLLKSNDELNRTIFELRMEIIKMEEAAQAAKHVKRVGENDRCNGKKSLW